VARHPNLLLELRTKFDWVENLIALKHEHRGQTVVSWSINAPQITEHDEAFTASLDRRIAAAERVIDAGYRVGFHFDPLIYFSGFEDGYRDTIERIFRRIQPESIAWISVSTLRYKPEMQDMMMTRFPESAIPFGEQVLGADNKQRYLQPLRMRMERFVWNELKARSPNLPLYMCMESAAVWKDIAGTLPGANPELTELFTKRGRLPVLPAQ
jgi:spore photoproduct lyase